MTMMTACIIHRMCYIFSLALLKFMIVNVHFLPSPKPSPYPLLSRPVHGFAISTIVTWPRRLPWQQIWMCGGTLLIVTCSHVGHVFRKATPYTFPGGTGKIINHNNARLAETWMDDWRDFYYKINPGSHGSPAWNRSYMLVWLVRTRCTQMHGWPVTYGPSRVCTAIRMFSLLIYM